MRFVSKTLSKKSSFGDLCMVTEVTQMMIFLFVSVWNVFTPGLPAKCLPLGQKENPPVLTQVE